MNNEPREKLRELIVEYGRSLCDDPRRCEALLKDYCGQYKREIFVLISAQKNRVADDLLKAPAGVPQVMIMARLVKRLEDELAMTAEAAQWAVDSWLLALSVIDQSMPVMKSVPALPTPPAAPPRASVASPTPPVLKPLSIFHDRLRDGSAGPAMIVIPAGGFWMGSPESEAGRGSNERRHRVNIKQSFAIGQYAVTFDEYDRFCAEGYRTKPEDENWGRGNRPVINISWVDALDYTKWLSAQAGKNYRLPTEAEWEYTARAGTETAFWWGNGISQDQANYGGNHMKIVLVDQFRPNPWGLYQVHGNIWEWTGSRYNENYGGAEMLYYGGAEMLYSDRDISGSLVGRGGAWFGGPAWVRSAARTGFIPATRNSNLGFRLARSL